jgi:hypothetical protein
VWAGSASASGEPGCARGPIATGADVMGSTYVVGPNDDGPVVGAWYCAWAETVPLKIGAANAGLAIEYPAFGYCRCYWATRDCTSG